MDTYKLHIQPLSTCTCQYWGLSVLKMQEIYIWQRLQICDVSNDGVDWPQCMMGNSQSAVTRYLIMYQDWGLTVPQKCAKIATFSQLAVFSRISVSTDTSAWLKALITHHLLSSSMHAWFKTGAYPCSKIRMEFKHYFISMIDFCRTDGADWHQYIRKKWENIMQDSRAFKNWANP